MTTNIKLPNIPTVTDFLKSVREDESVIIQKISDKFISIFKNNINIKSFGFIISDITNGYKLDELKPLVDILFDSYRANGYNITYNVYEVKSYDNKHTYKYINITEYSFVKPINTITMEQIDPPPKYTDVGVPVNDEKVDTKKKSNKHKFWKLWF